MVSGCVGWVCRVGVKPDDSLELFLPLGAPTTLLPRAPYW